MHISFKDIAFGKLEPFVQPAMLTKVFGNCFGQNKQGETIFYAVAKGAPSVFFAYNIDRDCIEFQQDMRDMSNAVDLNPVDGRVYIAFNTGFGIYDPEKREYTDLGDLGSEIAVMDHGTFDVDGNYYFGTYPNACLYRYDIRNGCLERVGEHMVQGNYIRCLAACGRKVYMGSLCVPAEIRVYDIETGEVTKLDMPAEEGLYEAEDATSVYTMSSLGRYFMAKIKYKDIYYCWVYDSVEECWKFRVTDSWHLHWSIPVEGSSISYMGGMEYLRSVDLSTGEVTDYPDMKLEFSKYTINPRVVRLADQKTYPGETLLFGGLDAGIGIANFETGTFRYLMADCFPKAPNVMRCIEVGYGDEMLCSVMQGTTMIVYDRAKKKVKRMVPCAQMESISVFDGGYYFGMYGDARLLHLEPETGEQTTLLGTMAKKHQDRSFALTDAGEHIVWGSIPYYGYLGGAIGVYEKKTGESRIHVNLIENQSITSLCWLNGKIYGTTCIYGGLGIEPSEGDAKVFRFDLHTGTVELQQILSFREDGAKQCILGHIIASEDGRLFVGSNNVLAELCPQTLEIVREWRLGDNPPDEPKVEKSNWIGNRLRWLTPRILLTNTGGKLTALDIVDGETCTVYEDACVHDFCLTEKEVLVLKNEDAMVYQLPYEVQK